jgi:hypothetical protein
MLGLSFMNVKLGCFGGSVMERFIHCKILIHLKVIIVAHRFWFLEGVLVLGQCLPLRNG